MGGVVEICCSSNCFCYLLTKTLREEQKNNMNVFVVVCFFVSLACYACVWNKRTESKECCLLYAMPNAWNLLNIVWRQTKINIDLFIPFIYSNNAFINYTAC